MTLPSAHGFRATCFALRTRLLRRSLAKTAVCYFLAKTAVGLHQSSREDMRRVNCTITNGGTFGSMLSTPIINAPQSAILGMHNIVDRPVAVNGDVKIGPMMYLAVLYDHRIIDGKDSVSFLRTINVLLEDPARLLLSV